MADRLDTSTVRLKINNQEIVNSYEELGKVKKQLAKDLNKLEVGTAAYEKKSRDLRKVSDRMETVRKKNKEVANAWKRQTADFNKGINSRVDGINVMGTSVGNLRTQFLGLTQVISGTTKASKLLKIALISTGIGAIVVALGSLIAYLTTVQKGMDQLTKVTRPLSVLFQKLLGIFQELGGKVFDNLMRLFTDPVTVIKEFGALIQREVMDRFEGLAKFGGAFIKLFSKDWKDGLKEMGEAALQFTGADDVINVVSKIADETKELVNESIADGTRLDLLIKDIRDSEIDMIKRRGALKLIYADSKRLATDVKATDEERIAAANRAEDALIELESMRTGLLEKKIAQMKLEHTFNDTSKEDIKELALLEEQLFLARAETAKKLQSIDAARNSAINAEQQRAKQAKADEQKAAAEKAKKEEEDRNKELERFQTQAEEDLLALKNRLLNEEITEEEFNQLKEDAELAHLQRMKDARETFGMETLDIQQQIADKELEIQRKKAEEEGQLGRTLQAIKEQSIKSFGQEAAAVIANAESFREAGKGIIKSIRQQIKAYIVQAISAVVLDSFKKGGLLGFAIAPAAGAAAGALFESLIPSFATGGFTGNGPLGLGKNAGGNIRGVVEDDEYVVNTPSMRKILSDPYGANVMGYLENVRNGGSASAAPAVEVNNTLDNSDMIAAAQLIKEAAAVLQSTPPPVQLSREQERNIVKYGQEDIDVRAASKSRGATAT